MTLKSNGTVTIQTPSSTAPTIKIESTGSHSTVMGFIVTGATSVSNAGIYFNIGTTGCTIKGNTINNVYHGIYLQRASNTIISDNTITSTATGIYVFDSYGSTISGNTVTGSNGILLSTFNHDNIISGNTISGCSNTGIYILGMSQLNTITNNVLNNNNFGIYLWSSNSNNIENNIITNCPESGITMDASTANTIKGNIITNCLKYGYWSNYFGNTITGNTIINNVRGIGLNNYVETIQAEAITFNRIYNNTEWNYINLQPLSHGLPGVNYNWWGSNDASIFGTKISGIGTFGPWLYMTINATPTTINNGETSLITVSFNNAFDGTTITPFDPATGHIPDGTPVTFTTDLGSIGCKTIDKETAGGIATATLTADELAGIAHITATTDAQTLNTEVTINPKSSLYLTVTPNKTNPVVGDTVIYTLKVGNKGPDTATDVVMTYVVPEGLEFAGANVDVGTYTYDAATRTITWTIGDVPVGDPYMWLSLKILTAGSYVFNPQLTTSTYDPTLNTDTQSITIHAAAASNNNTANAASTVTMQNTGVPIAALVLAILMLAGGLISSKK